MTRHIWIAAALAAALTGCATPQTAYDRYKAGEPLRNIPYKTGATEASLGRDLTNCRVVAAQRVPQQQVVQSTPGFTTPSQTICNRVGTQTICNTTGGQTFGGGVTTSDANAGLRQQVFGQCMIDRGYRYVSLPPCPQGAQMQTAQGLPPLSTRTCYVVTPNQRTLVGHY